MKKKYLNIALLVLVVVIYSSVFFKLFGKKNALSNDSHFNTTLSNQISNFDIKRNDFNIDTMVNDPFGLHSKPVKKTIVNSKSRITTKPSNRSLKTTFKWPKTTYYGFVKNTSNKTRLALIKMDNKLFRKREKELINDIQIYRVYSDSIILKHNNKKYTILKTNE